MRRNTQIAWLALSPLILAIGLTTTAQAADAKDVMMPLVAPTTDVRTEKTLTTAINEATTLPPASAFVLANRLRLRLGAYYLKNENYDKARAALKRIGLDSPAAISASLLLAESYRLQNDDEKAIQWFLRAAKKYPSNPVTLNGLISAAHEFEQAGTSGAAKTLYRQTTKQTQAALKQLHTLTHQSVIEPAQVFFPSALLDESVRKTLLTLVLQDPEHDLLDNSRTLHAVINKLLALQQQNTRLSQQLNQLTRQLQSYQQQQQTLSANYQQNQKQLQDLTQQIQPNDFSQQQLNIRHAVTQLRNKLQRQQATLTFIDRASSQLPTIIDQIGTQQEVLGAKLHHLIVANRDAIRTTLKRATTHYQTTLKDIAGKAMFDEGRMLEKLSAQPSQSQ